MACAYGTSAGTSWRPCYQRAVTSKPCRVHGARMPRPGIECRPEKMLPAFPRVPRSLAAAALSVLVLVMLGGCAVKHPTTNVVKGKVLFGQKCGSCHTLAHASTSGTTGPNLDDMFAR